MKKLAQRFDEVLAGVNMNRFKSQPPEERIAISCLATGEFFVSPTIGAAECVERDHLASFGVAKPNQTDRWHCEFALIGDHERYDVVFAACDLERPLVAVVLKIAD